MRLATKRSSSGLTALSLLATMYQLGLVFQATPGALLLNSSVDGGAAVAQTICCSASVRSPQKSAVASCGHPDAPVGDLDVAEQGRLGKLGYQARRGLVGIRSDCRDVDQADDAVIDARAGDDRASVGVADEDGRAADLIQVVPGRLDVGSTLESSAYCAEITS